MIWGIAVVALILAGCALLAAEILVIPGFGLVGVLGAASMIAAGFLALVKLGSGYGVLTFAGGGALALGFIWLLPKTKTARGMVLTSDLARARAPRARAEAGDVGQAVTPLRPAGTMEIEGRAVDVVTDGLFVDSGSRVRVVRVEGARVVVEPFI